ncbi:hypothetical protein L610_002600000110 [Aminobacter sp. J44]|nr:hypothetical protein L610_002600000110 [Aminobacter sp. J44]
MEALRAQQGNSKKTGWGPGRPSPNRYRKMKQRWLPNGQRLVYYQCRVTGATFALNLGWKTSRQTIHRSP